MKTDKRSWNSGLCKKYYITIFVVLDGFFSHQIGISWTELIRNISVKKKKKISQAWDCGQDRNKSTAEYPSDQGIYPASKRTKFKSGLYHNRDLNLSFPHLRGMILILGKDLWLLLKNSRRLQRRMRPENGYENWNPEAHWMGNLGHEPRAPIFGWKWGVKNSSSCTASQQCNHRCCPMHWYHPGDVSI